MTAINEEKAQEMKERGPLGLTVGDERLNREALLRDAKTALCAALDLLELEPATAALIPKAHKRALKYARSMGDKVVEGEG